MIVVKRRRAAERVAWRNLYLAYGGSGNQSG